MAKKNERMETLKNSGVDTSKYFTLLVNEDIPAGTKINIAIDRNESDDVAKQIIEDGYVRNTKLHRRFVAAQYMRMLNYSGGWHGFLNDRYGYMYQFDMMTEEIRVLSMLEKADKETFNERKRFFTLQVVNRVLEDYARDLEKYINGLDKSRSRQGRNYTYVRKYGNVFVDEIDARVIAPIDAIRALCRRSKTYAEMYNNLVTLKKVMVKLPWGTRKSRNWIDAFQKEGAFYTLKNLIMFHDVRLYYNGNFYDMYNGMTVIDGLVASYEGYQMNALLKEAIKRNNFNFAKSIEEHR